MFPAISSRSNLAVSPALCVTLGSGQIAAVTVTFSSSIIFVALRKAFPPNCLGISG